MAAALFAARLYYMLTFASFSLTPFLPLLFSSASLRVGGADAAGGRGLSQKQIGVARAASRLSALLAGPPVTAFADRNRKRRLVLVVSDIVQTVAMLAFASEGVLGSFPLVVLVLTVASMARAPGMPIVDAAAVQTAAAAGKDFGKLRLWGAVGWSVGSLTMATLTQESGTYLGLFMAYAALRFGTTLTGARLLEIPYRAAGEEKGGDNDTDDELGRQSTVSQQLGRVFLNTQGIIFLATATFAGSCFGFIDSALFVFLVEDLGATPMLLAMSLVVTNVAELPMFILARRITEALGVELVFTLTMGAYALRLMCYASLQTAGWVLPVELLHGITFALFYSALTTQSQRIAPPGLESTTQSLVGSFFFQIGGATGALAGGAAADSLGRREAFLVFAAGAAVWGAMRAIVRPKIKVAGE